MKKKLAMLLMTAAALVSLSACSGRAYYVSGPPYPHAYWVPGHYETGPYGGHHYVPGHWR